MNWTKGSGLATALFQRIFGNKSFQQSLTDAIDAIAKKVKEHINNPEQLTKIADNLQNNSKAVAGAIVKGTEAQGLVAPDVVQAADVIEQNANK